MRFYPAQKKDNRASPKLLKGMRIAALVIAFASVFIFFFKLLFF